MSLGETSKLCFLMSGFSAFGNVPTLFWVHCVPQEVVGCRGGSQHVEGIPLLENKKVWGFPYIKIEKLTNVHFMFLIDMKFISTILKICYGDLHHFRCPSFNVSTFRKLNFGIPTFQKFKVRNLEATPFKILKLQHVLTHKYLKIRNFTTSKFEIVTFQNFKNTNSNN